MPICAAHEISNKIRLASNNYLKKKYTFHQLPGIAPDKPEKEHYGHLSTCVLIVKKNKRKKEESQEASRSA